MSTPAMCMPPQAAQRPDLRGLSPLRSRAAALTLKRPPQPNAAAAREPLNNTPTQGPLSQPPPLRPHISGEAGYASGAAASRLRDAQGRDTAGA
jgi:hypothetical protein